MADASEMLGREWLQKIQKRLKARDDGWGKDAEAAEKAYANDEDAQHGQLYAFNILHANAETIVPAVFNSTPLPDIRERFQDGDKKDRFAADVAERIVSTQIDDAALATEMEGAALDAFVAGRGIVRVRFDTGQTGERVKYEVVPWRDYLEARGTRDDRLPWKAYRHYLDKAEYDGKTNGGLIEQQPVMSEEDAKKDTIEVWEVWCRTDKKVRFIRADNGQLFQEMDDPLGLRGFYPTIKPIQPICRTGKVDPVVPFKIYKKLADELDALTKRIDKIISALKVKGFTLAGQDDIAQLAQADDNQLVTASNLEAFAASGGLNGLIEWWPIETAIAVLRELYVARENVKQSIYEITGISDIVRGASDARETRGAQEIKNQWGSLRIRKMQTLIERAVRDLFVMTVELIAKFSPEGMRRAAGMNIPPEVEQMLRDPLVHYRIDVESDSTVRADLARIKGEMTEFLEGTAGFFQVMTPIAAQMPPVAKPMVNLYASFARQFNLGRQAEDALDELIELAGGLAGQDQEDPAAKAAEADMQLKAQDLQLRAQEMAERLAFDREKAAMDLQMKGEDLKLKQADLNLKGQDRQLKALEIGLKERELGLKEGIAQVDAAKAAEEIEIEKAQQRAAKIE